MARRVAADLPSRPDWLALANANLDRWLARNADSPGLVRGYLEWRELLSLPVERICAILAMDNDEGRRLRQNSPFAGALSPREVWDIKDQLRNETTRT